jgi:hypothetical protein
MPKVSLYLGNETARSTLGTRQAFHPRLSFQLQPVQLLLPVVEVILALIGTILTRRAIRSEGVLAKMTQLN